MNKKSEIITFTAKVSWEVWQCRTDNILTILTSVNEELWAGVLLCIGIKIPVALQQRFLPGHHSQSQKRC